MAICVIIYLIPTAFITEAEEGCFRGPLSKGTQFGKETHSYSFGPVPCLVCLLGGRDTFASLT